VVIRCGNPSVGLESLHGVGSWDALCRVVISFTVNDMSRETKSILIESIKCTVRLLVLCALSHRYRGVPSPLPRRMRKAETETHKHSRKHYSETLANNSNLAKINFKIIEFKDVISN
jgi:hypothetical protein